MITWFLQSLGIADDVVRHVDRAQFAFQRPVLFWVGLLLLIPVGWFIYRRQSENLPTASSRVRGALTATRVVVLLLLIFVLSGPHLRIDHQSERKPIVAFLLDRSGSMRLPAGPHGPDERAASLAAAAGYEVKDGKLDAAARQSLEGLSRSDLALAALGAAQQALLQPLAEKYDVRFYNVARGAAPLPPVWSEAAAAEMAPEDEAASHLGDAIVSVLESASGGAVAGMVLLSDGRNTGGISPTEATRLASRAGASIYSVPIGPVQRLRDVSVVNVNTSGLVSVNDTARVAVTIESQGFEGKLVTVELREGDTLLDSEEITLKGSEQQLIELSFEAKQAGPRYLTVQIPALEEEPEALHANNSDIAFVRVSDEKLRVLLVDGAPRWDFRFLKNAIRRDHGLSGVAGDSPPDVVVETQWRRLPKDQQAQQLPRTLDELAKYHVVILGDASPELISESFRALLAEAIGTKGLGVIVAAGPHHMPHRFDEPFLRLLPVQLASRAAGSEAPAHRPYRIEMTPPGRIHESMRLHDDPARSDDVWAQMPPFHWAAAAERPSAAATVLASNASVDGPLGKMPLVAWHYAGHGKVAFVGTDSTWLWRQNIGDLHFYKFWGQMMRFVARRDEAEEKRSRIEVRPVRAKLGEQTEVELFAFSAGGEPVVSDRAAIEVVTAAHPQSIELLPDAQYPGRYTGKFRPDQLGEHRISWRAAAGDASAEAAFRVVSATEELRDPNPDRLLLELLASGTGGQVLELGELATLGERLQGEPTLLQMRREASVWDNWLVLLLLSLVYSADLAIRRLIGLS